MSPVGVLLMALMDRARSGVPVPELICEVVLERLDATGVGLSLFGADGTPGLVAHAGVRARELEELQLTLGEGPARASFDEGRLVEQPDLAAIGPTAWPVYAMQAHELGIRAVFCVPLHLGGIRLGVLTVSRTSAGPLSAGDRTHLLDVADAAVVVLLHLQESPDLDLDIDAVELGADLDITPVVHQATGMVSVQAGVGLGTALLLLRGSAFASGRSVVEIAADVVARVVRFD